MDDGNRTKGGSRGYVVGPILGPEERPFTLGWEHNPQTDNGHDHIWELCLLTPGRYAVRVEEVVRCMVCHAPRCGYSTDDDPCMERRHHNCSPLNRPHRFLSGRIEKVGV